MCVCVYVCVQLMLFPFDLVPSDTTTYITKQVRA